jgi:hypothetical protein
MSPYSAVASVKNSTHAELINFILLRTGNYEYLSQLSFHHRSLSVTTSTKNFSQDVLPRLKCNLVDVSSPHLCIFRCNTLMILRTPKQTTESDTLHIRSVRPIMLNFVSHKHLDETMSCHVICFDAGSPTM